MIKGVHQKPRANITHNYGNLETLSLKSELFPQYFHRESRLFSTVVEILGNAIRQRREKQKVWKATKLLLFVIVISIYKRRIIYRPTLLHIKDCYGVTTGML